MSGVPVEAVYGDDDGLFPGQFPYTRGPYASMYRSKLWTMRMFAGFGTAEDTNERFKEILRAGGDGLSTAFDLPTLMGRDSDDPRSAGEVGKAGVAVDTLADMEDLFAGIDLGAVTTSMTINSPAADRSWPCTSSAAEKRRHRPGRLGGTLQNDILKEYQAQKEFIFPPRPSMRLVTDVMRFCAAEMPHWHPVSISGYHIREAGIDGRPGAGLHPRQRLRLRRGGAWPPGSTVDEFAPRLELLLQRPHRLLRGDRQVPGRPAHLGPLDARALRRHRAERSLQLRFHTQTAGVSLTAQQPEVNIARIAIEALAGVLGRHPEPPHQLLRRGAGPADREGGPHRPAHPAGHRPRDRRRPWWPTRSGGSCLRRVRSPTSWSARPRTIFAQLDEWAAARSSKASTPASTAAGSSRRDRRRRLPASSARSTTAAGSSSA